MRTVQVNWPKSPLKVVMARSPEASATSVRIKVEICGIYHRDVVTKEGIWPGIQYPPVPGHEIARATKSRDPVTARIRKSSRSTVPVTEYQFPTINQ